MSPSAGGGGGGGSSPRRGRGETWFPLSLDVERRGDAADAGRFHRAPVLRLSCFCRDVTPESRGSPRVVPGAHADTSGGNVVLLARQRTASGQRTIARWDEGDRRREGQRDHP